MLRIPRSIVLVPMLGCVAFTNVGCATTTIAGKYPHLDRRSICVLVPGIELDSTEFIFTPDNVPVSNFHPKVIDRVAAVTRTVFEYDPDADPRSVRHLPAPYDQLQCPARFTMLPSQDPSTSPLPEASLDLSVHQPPTQSAPMPEPLVKQLAGCPSVHSAQSAARLGALSYTMQFNVYIDENGEAVSAFVKQSTLEDRETALCMLKALRQANWSAPEAESVVTVAPASKLFMADGPSNLPNVEDMLKESLRKSTPSVKPPVGTPGGFAKPYYVTLLLGALIVGVTVGVTIFLLPRNTAPRCATEMNPITRQPYTSLEECEEVKRLSEDEIRQRRLAHIKATQPQAPPAPQPQPQPAQPNCPRNEHFVPEHTDDARGCYTKKGNLQCYSRRHYPCAGVHTHGIFTYQEMRGKICEKIEVPNAVRCEGPFIKTGDCGSVSTTTCGDEGTAASGIYLKEQRLDTP